MMASCSSVGSMAKVNPWTTQPSGGPNLRGIVVPDEAPPARLQRRGEVLGAEPGEAITVLDQDRRHLRVRDKPKRLSTLAVQPGPGLGDHAVGRKAVRDIPAAHASRLAVEVALVGRGHPCGDGGEAAAHPPGLEVTDQDELAHFARRDRERARPEPPIGGLRIDVLLRSDLTAVRRLLTRPASRSPTKTSLPILRAGTGSVPVRNHRSAVCG